MPAAESRSAAIALAYHDPDAAPRVVAKGRGAVAQTIVARARDAGIYVHESPQLLALLMRVDLDEHIPPQLYVAVAELLAWIYRLEQQGMVEGSGAPCGASAAHDASPLFVPPRDCGGLPRLPLSSARRRD